VVSATMETSLKEYEEWIQNERSLQAFVPEALRLLGHRLSLEEKHPALRYLRKPDIALDPILIKIREEEKKKEKEEEEEKEPEKRGGTILKDTGSEIPGLPERKVPSIDDFQKAIKRKRKRQRERTRDLAKKQRLLEKEQKEREELEKEEEDDQEEKSL